MIENHNATSWYRLVCQQTDGSDLGPPLKSPEDIVNVLKDQFTVALYHEAKGIYYQDINIHALKTQICNQIVTGRQPSAQHSCVPWLLLRDHGTYVANCLRVASEHTESAGLSTDHD